MWQEFVQRRVEQANRDRTAAHCLEDSFKIRTLERQQILKCAPAAALIARDDHLAHEMDPIALEEHVLGATQPDAFRAETARDARIIRGVGVGAHVQRPSFIRPAEQLGERLIGGSVVRTPHAANDLHDFGGNRW